MDPWFGFQVSCKACGVQDFYDIIFLHWGSKLWAMQEERKVKKPENESTDLTDVVICDDDGDSAEVAEKEEASLKQAEQGLILIDGDPYMDISELCECEGKESAEATKAVEHPEPPAENGFTAEVTAEATKAAEHPEPPAENGVTAEATKAAEHPEPPAENGFTAEVTGEATKAAVAAGHLEGGPPPEKGTREQHGQLDVEARIRMIESPGFSSIIFCVC